MRHNALLAACLLVMLAGCTTDQPATVSHRSATPKVAIDHWSNADWQSVLETVCTDEGMVRYDALADNANGAKDALFRYVGEINKISPANRPDLFRTDADKLAYYLNAYNALCMYGVFQKGLPPNVELSGIYYRAYFPVGRGNTNLDSLQQTHIRIVGDLRTHFAINNMTRSSPPLRREPYEGAKLDAQLTDQAQRFLSDPRGVQRISETKVSLSEIFTHFYPSDFKEAFRRLSGKRDPSLLEAIRPLAGPDSPVQTAAEYESMSYDWSLNRAP